MQSQTSFETQRGISSVEKEPGYALITVSDIPESEAEDRMLEGLAALGEAEVNIDFLKLALDGFSFIVPEKLADSAQRALTENGFKALAHKGRALITVKAPNVRDEGGLVARIAQVVIRAGAVIDSMGDMHSSVLLVIDESMAEIAVDGIKSITHEVELV